MSLQDSFNLMGEYNQWMNTNLYEVSSTMSQVELVEDRGAFFGSVLGTLNHILVADTIWLKRFSNHPRQFPALMHLQGTAEPRALTEILHAEFSQLRQAREIMDKAITGFVRQATDSDYEKTLEYENTKGQPFRNNFGYLVQHFFNHQTHHRGQLTVLLSQAGLDFGSTDLLVKIREIE